MAVPTDATGILLAYSTVGVSEPVADDLRGQDDVTVGEPVPVPSARSDFADEL